MTKNPIEIRGLTLHLPWAHLITVGAKRHETRSWETKYSNIWLAIHASKKFTPAMRDVWDTFPFKQYRPKTDPRLLAGLILGVVKLEGCLPAESVADHLSYVGREDHGQRGERALEELEFGDYSPGRWAWKLSEPMMLRRPITAVGSLGLWHLSASAADAVRAEMTL